MSDKQRLNQPNAIYYLELKSSSQRSVFPDRESFQAFDALLEELYMETGAQTLGYCLLPGSIHLLLRNTQGSISDHGHGLQQRFTQQYNDKAQRNGSVLQKHPLYTLVEPGLALLDSFKQLHYLPVSEKLVAEPGIYPWSSHARYEQIASCSWFDPFTILDLITRHKHTQRHRYLDFISVAPVASVDWQQGTHPRYRALASEAYIQSLMSPQHDASTKPPTLEAIRQFVCEDYGLDIKDLQLWRRHRLAGEIKGAIADLAIRFNCANLEEVATYLDEDPQLIENSMRHLDSERTLLLHKLYTQMKQKLIRQMNTSEQTDHAQHAEP